MVAMAVAVAVADAAKTLTALEDGPVKGSDGLAKDGPGRAARHSPVNR